MDFLRLQHTFFPCQSNWVRSSFRYLPWQGNTNIHTHSEYMYWVTCLSNGKVEKYPNEYNSVKWIMAAPFGNNFFHCRVRVWMCMYLILHSFHTLSLFNTRAHNQPFVRTIHTITERTEIYDCVWFIWSLCISLYPLILLTYGLFRLCVCTFRHLYSFVQMYECWLNLYNGFHLVMQDVCMPLTPSSDRMRDLFIYDTFKEHMCTLDKWTLTAFIHWIRGVYVFQRWIPGEIGEWTWIEFNLK